MRTHKLPHQRCPACAATLSAITDVMGREIARPGDLSMCAYCGSFLRLGNNRRVRVLSLEEVSQLSDPQRIALQRMRRVVDEVQAERKNRVPPLIAARATGGQRTC
jgi:hypothetical protein